MGWENVFHCEINYFCKKVLNYYWPDAKSYSDITKTDFTLHRGTIDIISGGFPCQPYSLAGKRKGKADDRHLWPQMLRAIREIQPRWVVGENVPGLLNWNRGMVLDEIKADLEAEGFEVFPPLVLPAAGKDAPHRRDRVWVVAYSNNEQREWKKRGFQSKSYDGFKSIISDIKAQRKRSGAKEQGEDERSREQLVRTEQGSNSNDNGQSGTDANSISTGWEEFNIPDFAAKSGHGSGLFFEKSNAGDTEQQGQQRRRWQWKRFEPGFWHSWPTVEPTIRTGDDGLSTKLDGITFSKHRNESIKAAGNAIVPQVVYEIFKAIEEVDKK